MSDKETKPHEQQRPFEPFKLIRDFFALGRFFWPFNSVGGLTEADNRNLLVITSIGLVPMILLALFFGNISIKLVFTMTALYFSILWAIIFYHMFPAPKIQISTSIFCFLGTGLVSISILSLVFRSPFLHVPFHWIGPERDLLVRAAGFFLWVSVPEELCKALMLYVLSKRAETFIPRTMVYYGMICGLGFGIYEGLDYQLNHNLEFAEGVPGDFLYLNLLRLTSLPVLHSIWTGIAGFFLGFGYVYPKRRAILFVMGITIPAILHGLFNTFNGSLVSLGIAIFSVLMLSLYMAKHDSFDLFLGRDQSQDSPSNA